MSFSHRGMASDWDLGGSLGLLCGKSSLEQNPKPYPEGEIILLYFGGDENSRAILGLVKGEF